MSSRARSVVAVTGFTALLVFLFSSVAPAQRAGGLTPQGGTVVSVTPTTGGGVTVGGTAAKPTVGLLQSCSSTQVLAWNGTAWACAASLGGGLTTSSDFTGTGSAGSPLDLSNDVTVPGKESIAGNTTDYSLTISGSSNTFGNNIALKPTPADLDEGSNIRWQTTGGTNRWSMGNNSTNGTVTHDFWLFDNTNSLYGLYLFPAGASFLHMGTTVGGIDYDNATHTLTAKTNNSTRLTQTDTRFTVGTLSTFDDDSTFEGGTCVINNAGITCGGTLITPGADITGVTAQAPISGGGASGAVNVGLTNCAANEIYKMNGGGTAWACSAASGGITNSASANYYGKSDGTNIVNGNTKDDGTNWTINTTAGGTTAKVTVAEASGNTSIAGTLDAVGAITENAVRVVSVAGTGLSKSVATLTLNMAGASCAAGQFMTAIGATGTGTCSATSINGTNNTTAKFTGANTVGNGWALDDGTTWGVTGKFAITEATGNAIASGTLGVTGDFAVNTNKFTVAASTGNTGVAGTLDVASTFTLALSQTADIKSNLRAKFISGDPTTPVLSACGSSPSIDADSNNLAGKFTIGTTAGGACTITWNGTWPTRPWCHAEASTNASLIIQSYTTVQNTTTWTLNDSGAGKLADGLVVYYWCTGGN